MKSESVNVPLFPRPTLQRARFSPETQVAIARARDRVTWIQECLAVRGHGGAIISVLVSGTTMFVAANGSSPVDHLLVDSTGTVIPHIPFEEARVLQHRDTHVHGHLGGRELTIVWPDEGTELIRNVPPSRLRAREQIGL